MLFLIPLALASASVINVAQREDTFSQFVQGVKDAPNIWSIPMRTWLGPAWSRKFRTLPKPMKALPLEEVKDEELKQQLEFLSKPSFDVELEYEVLIPEMKEHLAKAASTMLVILNENQEDAAVIASIKECVKQLKFNTLLFPSWLDATETPQHEAGIIAGLVGLTDKSGPLGSLSSVKTLLSGIPDPESDETGQLRLALEYSGIISAVRNLSSGKPACVNGGMMLRYAWRTAGLQGRLLEKLIAMIPMGAAFTVATMSASKQVALSEMVKAEDGQVYGIKYGAAEVMAFSLPRSRLPALLSHLNGAYGVANGIDLVEGVKCEVVTVKWYPQQEQPRTPLAMIRQYAMAMCPQPEFLNLGIILFFCWSLLQFKPHNPNFGTILQEKGLILELIDGISTDNAVMLVQKLATLLGACQTNEAMSHPVIKLFRQIRRALKAATVAL